MATMIDSLHTAAALSGLVSLQLGLYFPYTLEHLHKNDTVAFHDEYDHKSLHAMDTFFSSFAGIKEPSQM